jgi:phospholipid-translocating ATPase
MIWPTLHTVFFLLLGVYDQDAPEELLLTRPNLYRQGRLGLVYKPHSFWITMADSLYQSIVIFFLTEGVSVDFFITLILISFHTYIVW